MERPHIMRHIHLDTVDSTQSYLQGILVPGNLLVSCEEQTKGFGRQEKKWIHQESSLAFSFTLSPGEIPTLTPLEIAVLVAKFFQANFKIKLSLKWPNDLLNEKGEKCGGILMQNVDGVLIVGVGINLSLGRSIEKRKLYPPGFLDLSVSAEDFTQEIYSFILNNRLGPLEIRDLWTKNCFHLNSKVQIEETIGIFTGIGELGEALVQNGKVISIYSGQLNLLT